ncbi:hypothetical protein [Rhizobium leguminosarum]|uniref:hypothetical protein n=1 Tax=Rhizobium leguminosarum TaxID=384 RepID=UPI003F9E9B2E
MTRHVSAEMGSVNWASMQVVGGSSPAWVAISLLVETVTGFFWVGDLQKLFRTNLKLYPHLNRWDGKPRLVKDIYLPFNLLNPIIDLTEAAFGTLHIQPTRRIAGSSSASSRKKSRFPMRMLTTIWWS